MHDTDLMLPWCRLRLRYFYLVKYIDVPRVNRKTFFASIERRSSRQSKDVLRVNRNNVRKTNAKEDPSSIIKINMDETPGRGKQSKIKIATKFRYDESRKATHYHILPAAENSMLPALTAPIWSQQNGGKNSLRARKIFKPQRLREDSASKTPAIRFKEKARFKDEIAAAEPTSVYAVDEHATVQQKICSWKRSSTDEPIAARRRTHPAQTARDSCPGFGTYGCRRRAQARFLLLGRGAQVL